MNIEYFKEKLLEEKKILIEEIEGLGVVKVAPGNFDAKADDTTDIAENIELANMFEVEQTKDAVLDQLENRLMDIDLALNKIEKGVYGICEVSGELIEENRLEANPAARTNIKNREVYL